MIAAIAIFSTLVYLGVHLNVLICAAMFFIMMLVMLNIGGIGNTLGYKSTEVAMGVKMGRR